MKSTDRVPYAKREETIRKWCSCSWVYSNDPNGGIRRHGIHFANPDCPLHGDHAKEAPY